MRIVPTNNGLFRSGFDVYDMASQDCEKLTFMNIDKIKYKFLMNDQNVGQWDSKV
jgi:hypothetical protein